MNPAEPVIKATLLIFYSFNNLELIGFKSSCSLKEKQQLSLHLKFYLRVRIYLFSVKKTNDFIIIYYL